MFTGKIFRVLSYVLVAMLAAALTLGGVALYLNAQPEPEVSKLDALEDLILNNFIGEADQTLMGDAAADAMVGALGDRWSYYIPASEYASYLEQQKNAEKLSGIRGEVKDIAWGNQIRSYVMQPYTMVKDHRTNAEISNVGAVMDGAIDPLINAYLKWINTKEEEEA